MAFNLTKMTIYALISAIARDLRDMVTHHMSAPYQQFNN
ncbi:hypothetical protein VIAG107301_03790 [Vibrio agarivorans]